MKIDVLDFSPHINGMTTYGKHACVGLRAIGCDSNLVSFTKSGKPPEAWSSPDVAKHAGRASHVEVHRVVKWSEMTEYLRSLDGVVLNEPRNTIVDNAAVKAYDDPPYMQPLIDSQTPWTCMIGCPQYDPSYAPFLAELVDRSNVRGAVVAFPSFVPKCFVDKPGMRIVFSNKYPYASVWALGDPIPQSNIVCTAGRLAGNKGGWTSMLAVLDKLPSSWTYDIWGSCGRGVGPSTVVQIVEALRTQYGEHLFRWLAGGQEWMPFRTDPWEMMVKSSQPCHRVRYMGGFLQPPFFGPTGARILLNLSSASFTTGTVEYIGLEAMDAGCTIVTADHLLAGDTVYCTEHLEHLENASMSAKGFKMRSDPASLIAAIERAMSLGKDAYAERARTNRQTLLNWHDPAKHAELLTRCLDLGDSCHPVGLVWAEDVPTLVREDAFNEARWNPKMRRLTNG